MNDDHANTQSTDFSVVVPVYNSQHTLVELFGRVKSTFERLGLSFGLVFVEDCGSDGSWETLKELKAQYPALITAVKLSKNFGQHNAILCGLGFVNAKFAITLDDDLQTPPEEIEKLIEKQRQTDADVVYGIYPEKQHSPVKKVGSSIVRRTLKYGAGSKHEGSSFRLMDFGLVEKMRGHFHNFVYIDELLQWYTGNVVSTPVRHERRRDGKSGYSVFKLTKFALDLMVNYTTIPLRMMTWVGLLFSFVSFALGCYYIYTKVRFGAQLGFTSIIAATFFTSGIILFCLSIIGDYLRRLYLAQNQKPQYSIRKVL